MKNKSKNHVVGVDGWVESKWEGSLPAFGVTP